MLLKLGEILFKLRDYSPIPFVIIMFIYGNPVLESIIAGLIMVVIGESTRIRGVSHIGGVSRTRSFSTGQKLIMSGPFAHVRNPLYIGNFFLSTGFVVLSNVSHYFTAIFILAFFVQYIPIVLWEEENLKKVFPKEYKEFFDNVPRWIPSFKKYDSGSEKIKGDLLAAIKSEKQTFTAAIIVFSVLMFREEIAQFFSQYF